MVSFLRARNGSIDDPNVRPHILRSVTPWDEDIIQKITTSYPRAFFEVRPEKRDAICRATPAVLLRVRDEKDILIQALKRCEGSIGTFTYMRHLVEDRAFMLEAIYINPYLLEETPLKENIEFVIELISHVKDEIRVHTITPSRTFRCHGTRPSIRVWPFTPYKVDLKPHGTFQRVLWRLPFDSQLTLGCLTNPHL